MRVFLRISLRKLTVPLGLGNRQCREFRTLSTVFLASSLPDAAIFLIYEFPLRLWMRVRNRSLGACRGHLSQDRTAMRIKPISQVQGPISCTYLSIFVPFCSSYFFFCLLVFWCFEGCNGLGPSQLTNDGSFPFDWVPYSHREAPEEYAFKRSAHSPSLFFTPFPPTHPLPLSLCPPPFFPLSLPTFPFFSVPISPPFGPPHPPHTFLYSFAFSSLFFLCVSLFFPFPPPLPPLRCLLRVLFSLIPFLFSLSPSYSPPFPSTPYFPFPPFFLPLPHASISVLFLPFFSFLCQHPLSFPFRPRPSPSSPRFLLFVLPLLCLCPRPPLLPISPSLCYFPIPSLPSFLRHRCPRLPTLTSP